jgi:hypothetical protein
LHICWKILAATLVLYLISIISGFANDLDIEHSIALE